MELINELSIELWEKIKKHYDEGNYTDCIIDAMMYLTDTIREKSGLTVDGEKLVHQSFLGNDYKIHISPARTDTEKDIQRGYGEIIKGMYAAIRNPRHHDHQTDTKEDANIIIVFIDHILTKIKKSTGVFDEEKFFALITEKHFVYSHEYVQALIKDIPKGKRLDIAIKMILTRSKDNEENFEWVMYNLLENLDSDEIKQVYDVVSTELEIESEFYKISTIFKIMKPRFWVYTKKVVKMRMENILFEDIKAATYNVENAKCGKSGALATWADDYLQYFDNKTKWSNMLVNKMDSNNIEEIDYVKEYFWDELCEWNLEGINLRLKMYIIKGLRERNEFIITYIAENVYLNEEHPWNNVFNSEIEAAKTDLDNYIGI